MSRLIDADALGKAVLAEGEKVTRIENIIANLAYILDSLRVLDQIMESGSCNDCNNKECLYKPDWGCQVRYNCPFHSKNGEQAMSGSQANRWIKMSDTDGEYYCCNNCGEELPRFHDFNGGIKSICKTAFCPKCGANMMGE